MVSLFHAGADTLLNDSSGGSALLLEEREG